jgi:hypothetical protein
VINVYRAILNHIRFDNDTFVIPYLRLFHKNSLVATNDESVYKDMHKYFKLFEEDYNLYFYSWSVGAQLYESFQKYILECHQHGIITYLNQKYFPTFLKPDEEEDPRVLTMYMLSAGFYLWLGSIVVACIVFIGEHVVRYFSKRRREYRENLKSCVVSRFED